MKIKTSELTDAALDWAVAISEGIPAEELYIQKWGSRLPPSIYRRNRDEDGNLDGTYTSGPDLLFSRKWEAGGPIIEREGINLSVDYQDDALSDDMAPIGWKGNLWNNSVPGTAGFLQWAYGPTPLIAAMRCYVASKLGDEVGVPKELT